MLTNKPDAKIALFYQNDDAGKDYGNGFKKGLGPDNVKKMVIAEATYESTDPTIDSQIVKLKASGADVLFMHAIPKQAAQAIRKIGEIGWKPDMFFLAATSTSMIIGAEAGGLRIFQGDHLVLLVQGSERSAVAERQGRAGLGRLHEEVFSRRQHPGPAHRLWLRRGRSDGAGDQAMRRRL